jgi:hypothetical protein
MAPNKIGPIELSPIKGHTQCRELLCAGSGEGCQWQALSSPVQMQGDRDSNPGPSGHTACTRPALQLSPIKRCNIVGTFGIYFSVTGLQLQTAVLQVRNYLMKFG